MRLGVAAGKMSPRTVAWGDYQMSEPLFEKPLDDMLPAARPPVRPRAFSDPTARPSSILWEQPEVDLPAIARDQKWIILVILLYLLLVAGTIVLISILDRSVGDDERFLYAVAVGAVGITLSAAAIFLVILLAAKLYGPTTAVLLGLCQFVPDAGLIVLLVVNARATTVLRRNGVRIGLLGARRADLAALSGRSHGRRPNPRW